MNGLKNSIGVFNNPIAVWIDPNFLHTLPAREVRSGYAEMLKHALIADAAQWERLVQIKDLSNLDWQAYIPASVDIKRQVVLEDFYETGLRKSLNFGHTIGHAIESYHLDTPTHLLHGEAIAAGMVMEAWLSVRHGALPQVQYEEIERYFIRMYGHQTVPGAAFEELLQLMRQDKKNDDARINFTLLEEIGKAAINQTLPEAAIIEAIEHYNGVGRLSPSL